MNGLHAVQASQTEATMPGIYSDFVRVMNFFGDLLQAVGTASVALALLALMICVQVVAGILSYFAWVPWLQWLLRVALLVKSAVLACLSGLVLAMSWVDPGTTSKQARVMADLWEFFAVATGYIVFFPSLLVFAFSLSWIRKHRRSAHGSSEYAALPHTDHQ